MVTNELEPDKEPTGLAAAQLWMTGAVAQVTDTDSGMRLRTWLLLIVVGLCCLAAPFPVNAIGVGASLALAMSAPARVRR